MLVVVVAFEGVCVHVCICVYVYMRICVYVYASNQRVTHASPKPQRHLPSTAGNTPLQKACAAAAAAAAAIDAEDQGKLNNVCMYKCVCVCVCMSVH